MLQHTVLLLLCSFLALLHSYKSYSTPRLTYRKCCKGLKSNKLLATVDEIIGLEAPPTVLDEADAKSSDIR
jgi:hypothetical protein